MVKKLGTKHICPNQYIIVRTEVRTHEMKDDFEMMISKKHFYER